MGIIIMTKNGGLSVFDLSSAVAHLKHLYVNRPPLNKRATGSMKTGSDGAVHTDAISLSLVFDFGQVLHPWTKIIPELALKVPCERLLIIPQSLMKHVTARHRDRIRVRHCQVAFSLVALYRLCWTF